MPYISKSRSENLRNTLTRSLLFGELNYLYTVEFIRAWKENPRYETFHVIARCVERPESLDSVWRLTQDLKPLVMPTDLTVARQEAVNEFRRRVIGKYEDEKRKDKANIDPYEELETK